MPESTGPSWTNRTNTFRDAFLASDQLPTTMWITQPWHGILEIMGVVGVDAVFIDWEHTLYGIDTVERLIISCEAAGITPIVRAPGIDRVAVSQILDAGAKGILFPRVATADEAREAVRATRFAPRGTRGWSGSHNRTAFYVGGLASAQVENGAEETSIYGRDYIARAEDIFVQIMIETIEGLENIEEIASVEGVDSIIFGWGDFCLQVDLDFDRCSAAAATVYDACRRHAVGRPIRPGEVTKMAAELGGDFARHYVDAGTDTVVISEALKASLTKARAAAEKGLGG